MQHSDMPTCSLWIKECGTSNTQDGGISRITVKALGSITFPVEVSQPTPLQEQKQHWEVLGDAGAEQGAKDKAAARVVRSPLEYEVGSAAVKVITVEHALYQLFRASGFNNKPGRAPRGKLVRLVKTEKQ
eukprot:5435707-Pyramimonas_sp.AAC.1